MLVTEPLDTVKAERLVRLYFLAGCALLPWLWVYNIALFWKHRGQSEVIARYVWYSAIGLVPACLVLALWIIILHTAGKGWGIWVIHPGGDGKQQGMFSNAVYSNT